MQTREPRRIVLAIHGRHARAILGGRKTHELRRRLPALTPGDWVYLYETAPESAVIGGFRVKGVRRECPKAMWDLVGEDGFAISKSEFQAYVDGATEVVAIEVADPFRLRRSASVAELAGVDSTFRPPQSATFLRSSTLLAHLQALARSLHPVPASA